MNKNQINRNQKLKQKAVYRTLIRTINGQPVEEIFPQIANKEFLNYGEAFDAAAELIKSRRIFVRTKRIAKG